MVNIKLGSIATKTTMPLKEEDNVEFAINYMREHNISSIVVTKNDIPVGIFTEFDAVKIIANHKTKTTKLKDVMTKNVFCVSADKYVHDGYILMEEKGYRHLVVVDEDGKFSGVVTEGDFLRHLGFEEISKQKSVLDFMSDSILTIDENVKLTKVANLMSEGKCKYAIILKDNIPNSIVSEREIVYYCSKNSLNETKEVKVVANNKLIKIKNTTPLQEASTLMKEHGVHQLIVTDDRGNFVGIITRHDILRAIHGSYFDLLVKTIEDKNEKELLLKKQQKELERLANFDHLTELPNRDLFHKLLEKSAAKALRNGHLTAVILLDLDRFKDINDSYGHSIGDELLILISKRLKNRIRKGDVLARLGGDEFAIILEHITYELDAAKTAQSLLKSIKDPFELSNGVRVTIETSAGIVLLPKDSSDAEKILQYADSALNEAKSAGRYTYKFYTIEMTKASQKRFEYESKMKLAIKNNEFEMYYQPQVDIKTGKIISAEALIRWNDPKKGLIPPNDFIPIAEESALINDIGEWVTKTVCKQAKIWQDKGLHITIAINLSPNQLKYQNIPQMIDNSLQSSKCNPKLLEIEITESAIMQNVKEGLELLHTIKARGIRIAIDDFGTGYSSLAYLKQFPIDVLKIDKSFVDNLPFNPDDTAITKAIISMSKALGYQVLAEGVETKEQLEFLKAENCDIYQGYYKSQPITVEEFEELLLRENS